MEKKSVLKVVFLALLDRHKGSYRLLEIAEILRQLKSNVKIDVYGGSPNKSKNIFWIKYIIEELNVKITGADSKEYADEGRRLTNRTMPY